MLDTHIHFLDVDEYHSFMQVSYSRYWEHAKETCGRTYMRNVAANGGVIYKTPYSLSSDSEGLQTSWSMFKVDDIMLPLIAFSVSAIPLAFSAPQVLPFDVIIVNEGNGWDSQQDQFNAPKSGIYFIGLTTTSYGLSNQLVEIQVNQVPLAAITVNNTMQYGDTFTYTFLVSLSASDALRVYLQSGYVDNYGLDGLNLVGFLYEPIHGISVAWSVHRTTSAVGPMEPVSFDYVMVNVGCAWNNYTNSFTAPVSGIYYMNINAGKVAGKKVNFNVMWNGNPFINLLTEYTYHDGTETRGRAMTANLTQGDSLYIKLWNGTEVFSDEYKQTSFSGFLLYPN